LRRQPDLARASDALGNNALQMDDVHFLPPFDMTMVFRVRSRKR
jgi:hypothetical protein